VGRKGEYFIVSKCRWRRNLKGAQKRGGAKGDLHKKGGTSKGAGRKRGARKGFGHVGGE